MNCMESSVYEELHETLKSLSDQRKDIQKQIDQNNLQIHEAECFAQEILNKDEEDFTVFSPRRYEDIYRDQLNHSYDKKSAFEEQNKVLTEKRDRLDSMIHLLKSVSEDHTRILHEEEHFARESKEDVLREKLSAIEMQEVFKSRIVRELEQTVLSQFQEIMNKIELLQSFSTQDMMRVKLELSGLSKSIEQVDRNLTDLISSFNVVDYDEYPLHELLEKALYKIDEIYKISSDFEFVSCENRMIKIVLYQFFCKFCSEIQKYRDIDRIVVTGQNRNQKYEIRLSCENNTNKIQIDYHADGFMLYQLDDYISALGGTVKVTEDEIFISF